MRGGKYSNFGFLWESLLIEIFMAASPTRKKETVQNSQDFWTAEANQLTNPQFDSCRNLLLFKGFH
jgi:hypothetical protein